MNIGEVSKRKPDSDKKSCSFGDANIDKHEYANLSPLGFAGINSNLIKPDK